MEVRLQGELHEEGLESGLGMGNGRSWSKRGGQACMGGWEHMVEHKGIVAACIVQAQRPRCPPTPNLSSLRLGAEAPWQAACLLPACLSESPLCSAVSQLLLPQPGRDSTCPTHVTEGSQSTHRLTHMHTQKETPQDTHIHTHTPSSHSAPGVRE